MSLRASGEVIAISAREIRPNDTNKPPFTKHELWLMDEGDAEPLKLGLSIQANDQIAAQSIKRGDFVGCEVSASAYATRNNGAGLQLTALTVSKAPKTAAVKSA